MARYSPLLMFMWIMVYLIIPWFFVWLWRLTSRIQRKYIKWTSRIILGLLIITTLTFLTFVFLVSCLGIGAAGCM